MNKELIDRACSISIALYDIQKKGQSIADLKDGTVIDDGFNFYVVKKGNKNPFVGMGSLYSDLKLLRDLNDEELKAILANN